MNGNNNVGKKDWPADKYAIGAFIQHTISDDLIKDFKLYPNDNLLDIGCGDGSYTLKLAANIPNGQITAIDLSANMLKIAKSRLQPHNNITFIEKNICDLKDREKFSVIMALWSLRWVKSLDYAFKNIYNALEKGGRFFATIPHHNATYMRIFHEVLASRKFKSLENFIVPVSYITLEEIRQMLQQMQFAHIICEYKHYALELPSLEIFEKFVNGIGFFHGQVPDDEITQINCEMVKFFALECEEKYAGKCIFADDCIVVNVVK